MENDLVKRQAIIHGRKFQGLIPLAEALSRKLKDKYIDVAIVGQFKSGKSSLVNHLLQTDILPTGVIPVSAFVTRVQYGEVPRCLI
ncbi:MAG: dynamin family protein [Bacteroidales bacterium]